MLSPLQKHYFHGENMDFKDAQQDMNFAYFGGGTGVLVSGVTWCTAGLFAIIYTDQISMVALFFGGMLIHPLSILLAKLLKRTGKHLSNNPLGKLAIESTTILFIGLFLAFYVSSLKVEWFFPIMLMAIGVRYLIFNTLYDNKIYWLLGGILMVAGMLCILFAADFIIGAFVGGITEVVTSLYILNQSTDIKLKNIPEQI